MSLGIALACLAGLTFLGYLLLPIMQDSMLPEEAASAAASELEDLYIQREGAYATIKELEFDFETGKLIEEDFRELRARYAGEAAGILHRIDALEGAKQETVGGKRP